MLYIVLAYETMREIGGTVGLGATNAYKQPKTLSRFQVGIKWVSGKGERKVIATKTISAKTYSGY